MHTRINKTHFVKVMVFKITEIYTSRFPFSIITYSNLAVEIAMHFFCETTKQRSIKQSIMASAILQHELQLGIKIGDLPHYWRIRLRAIIKEGNTQYIYARQTLFIAWMCSSEGHKMMQHALTEQVWRISLFLVNVQLFFLNFKKFCPVVLACLSSEKFTGDPCNKSSSFVPQILICRSYGELE